MEGALKNNVCIVISKKATLSLFRSGLTRRERVHGTYRVGEKSESDSRFGCLRAAFLNRRAAARYRALASIITGRERFSWN